MSKNSPKRRRLLDRKRKGREVAKRRARAQTAAANSTAGRMRRAGRWPLLECRISRSWKEASFAQVLIARQGDSGITAGLFLVDLGCLGVKDCVSIVDHNETEYRAFVEHVSEGDTLEECNPALAVKVVEAGVAYASQLGFRPARDYPGARGIFGDIDPDDCNETVPCGKNGRPYYVAGPSDDAPRVLRTLEARLGPEGFDFLVEGSALGDHGPADDDPEFGPPAERDDPEAPTALRLRAAEQALVPEIFQHALECYGEEYLQAAWDQLWMRTDVPMDPEEQPEFGSLFVHWLAFNWIPGSSPGDRANPEWPGVPVARTYLDDCADELTEFQRRFIETGLSRPFSLYRVVKVGRDRYLELEDLLTTAVYRVTERGVTAHSEVGDVVFARVLPMDGEAIIVGSAPWRIPADEPFDVGELRERLAGAGGRLGEGDLRRVERDLRQYFFAVIRTLCEDLQAVEVGPESRAGRLWRWIERLQRRPEKERQVRRAMRGQVPAFLRPPAPD